MSMRSRLVFTALAGVALASAPARAQSVFDGELRLAPQFMRYELKAPTNETISQLAVPVFVSIPVGTRFTFDIGTAYTRVRATTSSAVSEISGLTDTQLRGNLTLGSDFVVVTGGLNLPTGQSSVTIDQISAAGRIGNDFLAFPISNMGTGFGATGGIAVARPLGEWNIGFGGAVRHSASYEPFNVPGTTLRFQPGNEYRARVGVDRPVGTGRVALGVTYSTFGDDAAGASIYNTGDRIIAQAVVSNSIAGSDVTAAAYNVFRAPGHLASGDALGRENIANLFLSLGLHTLGTIVEPSVEVRQLLQNVSGTATTAERSQFSYLGTVGLRTRLAAAGLSLYPSAGYTIGSLAATNPLGAATHADLTGFRAQLAVRITP